MYPNRIQIIQSIPHHSITIPSEQSIQIELTRDAEVDQFQTSSKPLATRH